MTKAKRSNGIKPSNKRSILNETGLTKEQTAFLQAFSYVGILSAAAESVKGNIFQHYKWLKGENADIYEIAFNEAKEVAADRLEEEALRRAVAGLRKYKFHNGKPVLVQCTKSHPESFYNEKLDAYFFHYYEHEYSDRLLETLLRANRPTKFGTKLPLDSNSEESHERAKLTITPEDLNLPADVALRVYQAIQEARNRKLLMAPKEQQGE